VGEIYSVREGVVWWIQFPTSWVASEELHSHLTLFLPSSLSPFHTLEETLPWEVHSAPPWDDQLREQLIETTWLSQSVAPFKEEEKNTGKAEIECNIQ